MASTINTAAVVHNVFGQAGSPESVTDEITGQNVAAGQLEGDHRRPVNLLIAAVPKTGKDPNEILVILLFTKNANQNIQVVKIDLSQVDLQVANDAQNLLDDDRRDAEQLLLGRLIELWNNSTSSDEHTQREDKLDNGSGAIHIMSRDVPERDDGKITSTIVVLLLKEIKNTIVASDTNRTNKVG